MRKAAICLLTLWVFLSGCEDEREDPGLPVLTVDVETNAFARTMMKWIYISEPSGKILDSDMVHAGTFTLNAAVVPEYVDVTIYTISELGGQRTHSLVTVRDVPKGKTIRFRRELQPFQASPGRISFEISNWDLGNFWNNNFFISPGSTLGVAFPEQFSIINNTMRGNIRLFTGSNDVLFVVNRNNTRLHRWANDVEPDDFVKLNLNDFTPFDHTLALPTNVTTGHVTGLRGSARYHLGNIGYDAAIAGLSLGYIDDFDRFETIAGFGIQGLMMSYSKLGSPPTSITFPQHTGQLTLSAMSDFNYQSSPSYDYYSAFFIGWTIPLSWQVIGGNGQFRIAEIPKELKQSFNNIKLQDLRFNNLEVRKRLDGYTYSHFVEDFLNPQVYPPDHEYYQILIYQ